MNPFAAMTLLILEVGMLIAGVYTLIAGKGPGFLLGGKDYMVTGTPARLIGILLMVPLPLVMLSRFMMRAAMGQEGIEISQLCEIPINLIVIMVVFVAVRWVRQPRPTD